MIEAYLKVLDLGYREVKESFEGLADANVWKRPAPGLLSVGELAGHTAYWEAIMLTGEGGQPEPDLSKCCVTSPLIDHRFGYYPTTIATSPSDDHLKMTAEQVVNELLRVHEASVSHFKTLNPDLDNTVPGWSQNHTYGGHLRYAAFHVSYHTGQIYSVRHLLGEKTPDN